MRGWAKNAMVDKGTSLFGDLAGSRDVFLARQITAAQDHSISEKYSDLAGSWIGRGVGWVIFFSALDPIRPDFITSA